MTMFPWVTDSECSSSCSHRVLPPAAPLQDNHVGQIVRPDVCQVVLKQWVCMPFGFEGPTVEALGGCHASAGPALFAG
ncbi:hypothetical protein [Streptomyces sp. NPDC058657]|uniref:hypothetical protein n=1 Tax=unclassified Streptomyces TaxID=2593676 RepID=UPI003662757E